MPGLLTVLTVVVALVIGGAGAAAVVTGRCRRPGRAGPSRSRPAGAAG
ncbi:hypothetical protein J4032_14530 [Streptomyces formicae]|uniref:Uncharacterized protein n=1 Tax=Streptomyces formicae TaxID=1616117 RepID=A0ABY3WKC5_9ACTN|nr:hypothetical protein [Streptomyces formicae]UNM12580.1 hypothetical protein J4032_14530 [Streptomyces formicae]